MSLLRLVYYSAVIGGWAAFFGWLIAEFGVIRPEVAGGGNLQVVLVTGIVGAAIGAGLNIVAGMSNPQWMRMLKRSVPGILGGGVGGAIGGLVGNLLYTVLGDTLRFSFSGGDMPLVVDMSRVLGFMVLGMGVGVVDGVFSRSKSKIRNGLIGGCLGGLIGGFLFDTISLVVASSSGMSSRATAFVLLGVCIGALIGFTQLILRDAWLTVLDGYLPGRELLLTRPVTVLGRADHLELPFVGPANAQLEAEHVRIVRQANGSYSAEDDQSQLGTTVNQKKLQGPQTLRDGDEIKFGTNFVRFNQRRGKRADATVSATSAPSAQPVTPPPPPSSKKKPVSAVSPPKGAPKKSEQQPAKPQPQAATGAAKSQTTTKPAAGIQPPPPPPKKKKK